MSICVRLKHSLWALALCFAQQAEARFYAPGLGDPHRDGSTVQVQYSVVRPAPARRPAAANNAKLAREEATSLAQRALNLPLPGDRPLVTDRGPKLRAEFQSFFSPFSHPKIFVPTKVELVNVSKPTAMPDTIAAERHLSRANLLLQMLRGENREAAATFWSLANLKDSTDRLRRRDALFAGIAAGRMHWENSALMAFDFAIDRGLGRTDWLKDYTKIVYEKLKAQEKAGASSERIEAERARIARAILVEKEELAHYTAVLTKGMTVFEKESSVDLLSDRLDEALLMSFESSSALDRTLFSMAKRRHATDDDALQSISKKLSDNSQYFEKLELVRALSLIENRKHKAALQMLKNLAMSESAEINEKARVNLARLLAIFSQYDQALTIYRTIPLQSLIRLDSLLEIAWLEFENGDFQYSLGKSIGLQTRFYDHAFVPEIFLLEAYSRKNMCDFGGAEQAMNNFKQHYSREIRELRALVSKRNANKNFSMYGAVKNSFRSQGDQQIRRYERYLLQVPAINTMQMTLFGLQEEQKLLQTEPLSQAVRNNSQYMQDREFLISSLGKYYEKKRSDFSPLFEEKIYEELKYLDRKLLALFQQSEYITLDISAAADASQSLQAALNYPEIETAKEESIPDTKARWPFEEKEFWEDEIAWLRVTNPSKCVPKSKDDPESSPLADAR